MTDVPVSQIRNFSIIAHIDHGKSTLADRLLQVTKTVADREMKPQLLDNMDLERERGITIKLQAARMNYRSMAGEDYVLNLIDTPGHVDFTYEVSRSLAACEGALLVVDASQGVEAQTLANVYLALENNLEIIPIINKIDLPSAEPERVIREIEDVIGLDCSGAIMASAKSGIGIDEILEAVVKRVPPPKDTTGDPLRALIFDSYYDPYRGVIVYVRIMDGTVSTKDTLRLMASGQEHDIDEIGVLTPAQVNVDSLHAGEVGFINAAIKTVEHARVGDTITLVKKPAPEPLPGYTEAKPMVFCGMFPTSSDQYNDLKDALEKLKLNDAALNYEPEVSNAMGFGFRCGFLGLLHMEVVQERLEREYNLDLVITAPSVVYRVTLNDGSTVLIDNPSELPSPNERTQIEEPIVKVEVILPENFVGALMELCETKRGTFKDMRYLTKGRTTLVYELPLAEVVTDFFDQLKSRTRGYASMDYQLIGYKEDKLVRLDVLIKGEIVDSLSTIAHQDKAYYVGRLLVSKLKELIPRHQFEVPIQAAIGSKVVARETIPALRKNVLAKCYGGDISRKRKLLDKQKEGKKRMKSVGTVDVPQEAFMAVLKLNSN
ncbi:MAG: elongation factor 4 [Synechococcaceae cyanobacterium SM2_3_2]|nr:elongation factor 4 [Synechococcaceae cyanobacterium SM2_3_2]